MNLLTACPLAIQSAVFSVLEATPVIREHCKYREREEEIVSHLVTYNTQQIHAIQSITSPDSLVLPPPSVFGT